jgi:hypothetical protein
VALAPAKSESQTDVFAAGTVPRSYPLPNGATLTLEPGTIVDTVNYIGGNLKLRLVQGEATIFTTTSHNGNMALLVGNAELIPAGNVRVRHHGTIALVRVLEGTMRVNAPDAEPFERDLLISQGGVATVVPIRRVIGTFDQQHVATAAPDRGHEEGGKPGDEGRSAEAPVSAVVANLTLLEMAEAACRHGDDISAHELFSRSGHSRTTIGGSLLECLQVADEIMGTTDITLFEAIANGSGSNLQRILAARYLVKHFNKSGATKKAELYQALVEELKLESGPLLSAESLCHQIQAEEADGNRADAIRLGGEYLAQFPDGPCTTTVEALLAKHKVGERKEPESDDKGDGR